MPSIFSEVRLIANTRGRTSSSANALMNAVVHMHPAMAHSHRSGDKAKRDPKGILDNSTKHHS